jgi:hypothetical protein
MSKISPNKRKIDNKENDYIIETPFSPLKGKFAILNRNNARN